MEITDEDLDQVEANNFVTKVIYLPDPRFQELAIAGVETLVSTRLEPGIDPVAQAERQGTVMAILRMGNMDLEMPGQSAADRAAMMFGPYRQMAYQSGDGETQHVPPMPVAMQNAGMMGVPSPMISGFPGAPGMPAIDPNTGQPGAPTWGSPYTSTPIGLLGPPHIPFGGPAGLKSHTVRNFTDYDVGKPVKHMLIDVKHSPGIRMPKPVNHIQYSETHPAPMPGETSYPNYYPR